MIKVDVPTFEHTMISGQKIKCRPFLVKEEKLFLIAMESDDDMELYRTTMQVIGNCVLEENFETDTLPFFEVDYLLLHLRAQSIGRNVRMTFVCHNEDPNKTSGECGQVFQGEVGFDDVKVYNNDEKSNKFTFGNIGIEMKYPPYSVMQQQAKNLDDYNQKFELLVASINSLWDSETVYKNKDLTKKDIEEFLEGLTKGQYDQLQEFIDGAPYLRIEKRVKCPKCGNEDDTVYEGLEAFFA